jgi:hypothetical protein
VGNLKVVLWMTYGDVVEKSGAKMLQFTHTFFDFMATLSADVAASLGPIGLSFDVEHIDPEYTKQSLQLAQSRKADTKFPAGNLLVQHTIEGEVNPVGTDYVMRYADSGLIMLYRNYNHDPTGKYQDDSNLYSRAIWFLKEQCQHCLDEAYVAANYIAKVTAMMEASCEMGASCGKVSFCAHDGPTEGAMYMADILDGLTSSLITSGAMTESLYNRLFDPLTPYSVHNWDWYRCFAPFSDSLSYPNCAQYHALAAGCRGM